MLFSLFLWFLSERRAGGKCSAGREEEHMVLVLLCSHMLPGLGGGGMGASQGVSLLQYIPRFVGLVPASGACLLCAVQFLLSEAQPHCRNMLYITVLGEGVCWRC